MKNFYHGKMLFLKFFREFLTQTRFEDFTYSNCTPDQVSSFLLKGPLESITIKYSAASYYNTLAWFSPSDPNTIWINSLIDDRMPHSIAGSIAHEYVHLVDHSVEMFYFGHPKRRLWNKKKVLKSAPYMIGREFKKYLLQI